MSRRKRTHRGRTDQAAADASLDAVRQVLTEALNTLIVETRANHDPDFTAQAVAQLVEGWARSALAMIRAASHSAMSTDRAEADLPARSQAPSQHVDVRGEMLASLELIVAATRAGDGGVEESCHRFADTFNQCLIDEVAAAYLRTLTAFEMSLGVAQGPMN